MVDGIARRLAKAFDDVRWGRQVGVADSEAYDIDAAGLQGVLFLVDLREQIRRKLLNSLRFLDCQQFPLKVGVVRAPNTRSPLQLQTLDQTRSANVDDALISDRRLACRGDERTRISARRNSARGIV